MVDPHRKPLGEGFVMFSDPSAATVALEAMNGYHLLDKVLRVSLAAHTGALPDIGSAMSGMHQMLDNDLTERTGVKMNAGSRAALMQKLAGRDNPSKGVFWLRRRCGLRAFALLTASISFTVVPLLHPTRV